MANNKSVLTLTLASFVPIVRLPSLEDLCIFDIKFLLSSRLLSCWLFLTCRPRSPNFPIFNAGPAASHTPPPRLLLLQLNAVWLLLLACAVCTVLELQCAALSSSCTLKPVEQCSPLKNDCSPTQWLQFVLWQLISRTSAWLLMTVGTSYFGRCDVLLVGGSWCPRSCATFKSTLRNLHVMSALRSQSAHSRPFSADAQWRRSIPFAVYDVHVAYTSLPLLPSLLIS